MADEELQHLRVMRQTYIKRLRKLEEQAATFGNQAPIHILTEIDDLTKAIGEIDAKIDPSAADTWQAESVTKRPVQGTDIKTKLGPVTLVAAKDENARRRSLVPVALSAIIIALVIMLGSRFIKLIPADPTTSNNSLPTAAIQQASPPPAALETPISGNVAGAAITPTVAEKPTVQSSGMREAETSKTAYSYKALKNLFVPSHTLLGL